MQFRCPFSEGSECIHNTVGQQALTVHASNRTLSTLLFDVLSGLVSREKLVKGINVADLWSARVIATDPLRIGDGRAHFCPHRFWVRQHRDRVVE